VAGGGADRRTPAHGSEDHPDDPAAGRGEDPTPAAPCLEVGFHGSTSSCFNVPATLPGGRLEGPNVAHGRVARDRPAAARERHAVSESSRARLDARLSVRARGASIDDASAHNRPRISQRSGKTGWKSVRRRYSTPAEPPVPRFVPIVRSTIF